MGRSAADRPEGAGLYQIVCLSCGYRRAWTTLVDARADGHCHDAEHTTPYATSALRAPLPPKQQTGGDAST
jgi:hypothetical protein